MLLLNTTVITTHLRLSQIPFRLIAELRAARGRSPIAKEMW